MRKPVLTVYRIGPAWGWAMAVPDGASEDGVEATCDDALWRARDALLETLGEATRARVEVIDRRPRPATSAR